MAELFLLFIMALIASILYNWGTPRFYGTTWGTNVQKSAPLRILATGLIFFLAITVSAWVLSKVYETPRLG